MMSRSDFEGILSDCTDAVVKELAECSPSIWGQEGVARDLSFLASVINDYLLDSHPDAGVSPNDLRDRAFLVGVGLRLVMRQAFLAAESKNKK